MARPLRLEFAGALYHVTSRGDRREAIFLNDGDRETWLGVLGRVCARFNWLVHSYCQMTNHYHVLVETPDGNLSAGMRLLNGHYTQLFNRRHVLVGHLFQGRYKAILVQKETYLLELTRYIVLNPLRANMVKSLESWPWSSYPAMIGLAPAPDWFDTDWLLSQFHEQRSQAISAFNNFVLEGLARSSPLARTRHQFLLGDDSFEKCYRKVASSAELREISKAQKRALALPLEDYTTQHPDRNEAMAKAYLSGAYTMAEIGIHFRVHYMTVSRAVRRYESEQSVLMP